MMSLRGLVVCSCLALLLVADYTQAEAPTTYATQTEEYQTTEEVISEEPSTVEVETTESTATTTTIPSVECCKDPQTGASQCCIPGETCCNGKCYREQCTCCNDNCYLPGGSACCKSKGACPPGGSCCQKDNSWPWCCDENSICCPNLWGCCPKSSGCATKVCKFALLALGKQSVPLKPAH